jgi:hypothetical protein
MNEILQFRNIENNTAFVINLRNRPDRWININRDCGHIFDLRRIEAVRETPGWKGCLKSHQKILTYAQLANLNTVLVLEDDCKIVDNDEHPFNERWSQIKGWLDANLDQWDIFIGGTTIFGFVSPDKITIIPLHLDLGISRISKAFTTHFTYYNRSVFSNIINHPANKQIDVIMHNYKLLIASPFLAIQAASYSDITNVMIDDSDKFKYSENVIKNSFF